MKDSNLDDLIDAYLKDKLNEEQKLHLDQQMQIDPELRKMVSESETAYGYLQYKKYQQIRHRLQSFDRVNSPQLTGRKNNFTFKKELLLLGAIILLTILYLGYHFNPENVASRNLLHTSAIPMFSNTYTNDFTRAINLFHMKNYVTARDSFEELSQGYTGTAYHAARWNALMSRLARDGFTPEVIQKLIIFSKMERLELDQRSKRILSLSRSRILQWFIYPAGKNIPQLRPRLM